MAKCKHSRVVREAFLNRGTWGEYKRCRDCNQHQSLGPSNDDGFVSYEIAAAELASKYPFKKGERAPRATIAGFTNYDPPQELFGKPIDMFKGSEPLRNLYDVGLLASYIVDTL